MTDPSLANTMGELGFTPNSVIPVLDDETQDKVWACLQDMGYVQLSSTVLIDRTPTDTVWSTLGMDEKASQALQTPGAVPGPVFLEGKYCPNGVAVWVPATTEQ